MANLMDEDRWTAFPAPEFRDKVMQALFGVWWDRTQAQGTNWIAHA